MDKFEVGDKIQKALNKCNLVALFACDEDDEYEDPDNLLVLIKKSNAGFYIYGRAVADEDFYWEDVEISNNPYDYLSTIEEDIEKWDHDKAEWCFKELGSNSFGGGAPTCLYIGVVKHWND